MDRELRDARRSGDRQTLLKILWRRTSCIGESSGFNWNPFRRFTEFPSARLRVVEVLKPDWAGVKGIRWDYATSILDGFTPWFHNLKLDAIRDINHNDPVRRREARRQLKSILLMEAQDEVERTHSYSFVDFYVISTLSYEPKNRRQKREVAKLRADFTDWLPELRHKTGLSPQLVH